MVHLVAGATSSRTRERRRLAPTKRFSKRARTPSVPSRRSCLRVTRARIDVQDCHDHGARRRFTLPTVARSSSLDAELDAYGTRHAKARRMLEPHAPIATVDATSSSAGARLTTTIAVSRPSTPIVRPYRRRPSRASVFASTPRACPSSDGGHLRSVRERRLAAANALQATRATNRRAVGTFPT